MSGVLSERQFEGSDDSAASGWQHSASNGAEEIGFWLFLVTIAIFAFIHGDIGDPARSLLVVLLCVFCVFRGFASIVSGSFRISDPVLILPLVGIVGLAIFQILPLQLSSGHTSDDPFETKGFIIFFSALVLAGECLRHLTTNARRLRILVGTVIAVGVCSAAYGIARSLLVAPSGQYAQFANRNHYAFLAEMSLGLLLGSLIKGRLSKAHRFVCSLLAGVLLYSLFTAGSRGGIASLIAMLLFSVIAVAFFSRSHPQLRLSDQRSDRSRLPFKARLLGAVSVCVLIVIVSIAAIAFVGGSATVTRMEQVRDEVESRSDTRLNRGTIWNVTIDLIKERPVTGAGFGAYATAITRFDHSNGSWPLEQAHSEYLEILANGGIVGLTLFCLFFILAGRRAFRNLRAGDRSLRSTAFGATVGIFGVLIHSLVDFGLHVPLNALVFVVLLVVATNGSRRETPGEI